MLIALHSSCLGRRPAAIMLLHAATRHAIPVQLASLVLDRSMLTSFLGESGPA